MVYRDRYFVGIIGNNSSPCKWWDIYLVVVYLARTGCIKSPNSLNSLSLTDLCWCWCWWWWFEMTVARGGVRVTCITCISLYHAARICSTAEVGIPKRAFGCYFGFFGGFFWLWLVVREGRDGMGWGDVLLTPTRKHKDTIQPYIHSFIHRYIYTHMYIYT